MDVTDLSERAGLNARLATDGETLEFGPDIRCENVSDRPLSDLCDVLLDPCAGDQGTAYRAYRGVCRSEDEEDLKRAELRFDLLLVPEGCVGRELRKTAGHVHVPPVGEVHPLPEIYFVLAGTALYVIQHENPPGSGCVTGSLVFAEPGDKVAIAAQCGHVTVNVGDGPLVNGNWVSRRSRNDYEPYRRRHGAAWYIVRDKRRGFQVEPNTAYERSGMPPIRRPEYVEGSGLTVEVPAYDLRGLPAVRDYLTRGEDDLLR